MEPESSLPCSQVSATYPFLSQINPFHANIVFLEVHFNIIFPSTLRSSKFVSCSQASSAKPTQYFII